MTDQPNQSQPLLQADIGVVIPMYNASQYIRECLKSIFAQTRPVRKVIVVDDGSTDASAQIVQELQSRWPNLEYILQPNSGQARARNVGAAAISTALVAFCDADDTWFPNKLELQLPLFDDPDIQFVYSNALIINQRGQTFGTQFDIIHPPRGNNIYRRLWFGNFVNSSTVVFRKPFLDRLQGFSELPARKYIEDYDFWLRAAKAGASAYIDRPLVTYLRHSSSTSHATRRTSSAALRVIAAQPHPGFFLTALWIFAISRQLLVVGMYALRLDRLLSPLRRASAVK